VVFTATDINDLPLKKEVVFKIKQSSEKLNLNNFLRLSNLITIQKKDGVLLLTLSLSFLTNILK
jgi:hypothetical protein